MPSPFPGMDPYLEEVGYFHPIHQGMIDYIREQLQPLLPEPYYAEMEDRMWIQAQKPDQRVPDVNVLREDNPTPASKTRGGIAVAETVGVQPVVVHVPLDEMSELYLNIYARHDDRERIVTTIEVLSITNKTPKEQGRKLYRQKQRQTLESDIHLLEIDLLRAGKHTTAVPLARLKQAVPTWDYHACLKRFDEPEEFYVWPIQLPDRLPTIAVPLLPGDGAVPLDLQKAFDRAYDTGPYSRRVRYSDPLPTPALSDERSAWVRHVLREKGRLPA